MELPRSPGNEARHPSAPAAATPMLPFDPSAAAGSDDLHELRVRIPVDLHRQLLSLKVLRGRSLAETVALALDIYFTQKSREGERPPPTET